jgi:hypothetical protein
MNTLDASYTAPRRGSGPPDRAVLLAHGAGADKDSPALVAASEVLRGAGIPSLRFNFAYRAAGRRAPDRAPVLQATVREAVATLARRTKLAPERIVLAGRSMGGRIASLCVADGDPALGLALLAYPLHPPGKPEQLRTDHLERIRIPTLFVSGTRDSFATPEELTGAAKLVRGEVTMHWLESADHGYKPLKASGLTLEAVVEDVAHTVTNWVRKLR